jgi:hypothetical protein
MSNKPDGGPAFPRSDELGLHRAIPGMSLRDWFAGMAMQGMLADGIAHDGAPRFAYRLADAMLAEREK